MSKRISESPTRSNDVENKLHEGQQSVFMLKDIFTGKLPSARFISHKL